MYWCKLYSDDIMEQRRELLLAPLKMFEGLDRISELAMPFASTRPSSLGSRSKWWVIVPGKARLSKRHGFSVLLSRTSAPSGSS